MNRKWLLGTILVLTVIAITFIFLFTRQKRFNTYIIKEEKWNELILNKKNSTGIKIEKLKLDDYSVLIDEKASTIYYSAINHSNQYNPKVMVKLNDHSLDFSVKEEITKEKVAGNHTFELMIYNKNEYRIYQLVVTNLPIVNITYNYEGQEKIPMEITLFDNNKKAHYKTIHSKGVLKVEEKEDNKNKYAFSLSMESLGRNKRENNVSFFGMERHSEYTLDPLTEDKDRARSIFATNLWAGLENKRVDRNHYVELFVNNKYSGLYSLGYNIEKDSILLGEEEFLFLKKELINSEKESGNSKHLEGYTLFDREMLNKNRNISCQGSKCNSVDAWKELNNYYSILQSENTEAIKSKMNEKNAIDLYLYYLFVQASSNVTEETFGNTYMIFKNTPNGYKVHFKPWIVENAFGSNDERANNNNFVMPYNPVSRLIELKDEQTIKKVKGEYKKLRSRAWSEETLEKAITMYEHELFSSGAYQREKDLYKITSGIDNLDSLREYVKNRLEAMDEFMKNL